MYNRNVNMYDSCCFLNANKKSCALNDTSIPTSLQFIKCSTFCCRYNALYGTTALPIECEFRQTGSHFCIENRWQLQWTSFIESWTMHLLYSSNCQHFQISIMQNYHLLSDFSTFYCWAGNWTFRFCNTSRKITFFFSFGEFLPHSNRSKCTLF